MPFLKLLQTLSNSSFGFLFSKEFVSTHCKEGYNIAWQIKKLL